MPVARKALRHPPQRTTAKTKTRPAVKPRRAARPKAGGPAVERGMTTPDGVTLHRIDHLTIRAQEKDMEMLRDFYAAVLCLKPGKRPNFAFHGYWMYMGDRPVVHLASGHKPGTPTSPSGATIGFDHVSFRTSGLQAMRDRLRKLKVKFDEVPVPGYPLHQIFFRDPVGMKVELTFDLAELEANPA